MQYVNRNNFGQNVNGVPLTPQPLPTQPQPQPQPQPEPEPQVQPQPQVQQQVVAPAEVPIAREQEPPVQKVPSLPTQGLPKRKKLEQIIFNTMEINSTDILNLYRDHATIERAVLKESGDTRAATAAGFGAVAAQINGVTDNINTDIKTTGWLINDRVQDEADRVTNQATQFYISGQQRANEIAAAAAAAEAASLLATAKLEGSIAAASAAAALESARLGNAIALGQASLSKEILDGKYQTGLQIAAENEKTRDLINSLKTDELNRILIERNTDLNHSRHDYWGARDGLFNSQFAALSSQVNSQFNALNSQVAETRQGMVNFGTMAGVGQSSTSNAVR